MSKRPKKQMWFCVSDGARAWWVSIPPFLLPGQHLIGAMFSRLRPKHL